MIFSLLYSKVLVDTIFFNILPPTTNIDFDQTDNLYISGVLVFPDEFL